MKKLPSKSELIEFSNRHYTYINQIFGDQNVREDIEKAFPEFAKKNVSFQEDACSDFDEGQHWMTRNVETGEVFCSVEEDIQNLNINKNDTLCQSYSLMKFFHEHLGEGCESEIQKKRQMTMIKMYKKLLNNSLIIQSLSEFYHDKNPDWKDYTKYNCRTGKYPNLYERGKDVYYLIRQIHNVLDYWESDGFNYFIGNGTCPKQKKSQTQKRGSPRWGSRDSPRNRSQSRERSRSRGGKKNIKSKKKYNQKKNNFKNKYN